MKGEEAKRLWPWPRKGEAVVVPGFGMMEGDFNERVAVARGPRFKLHMGILTQWWRASDFRWIRGAWVHRDLLDKNGDS